MIEKSVLIVIEIGRVWLFLIERGGETQHVIGVASFRASIVSDIFAHIFRRGKVLMNAVAAIDPGAVFHHGIPEKRSSGTGSWVASQFVNPLEAGELGHLGIGMDPGQLVLAIRSRIEQGAVGIKPGIVKKPLLTGDGIDIGQHLSHSSVFTVEHSFTALIRQIIHHRTTPIGKANKHLLGRGVAAMDPRIAQAGKLFVNGIERSPIVINRLNLARTNIRFQLACERKRHQ